MNAGMLEGINKSLHDDGFGFSSACRSPVKQLVGRRAVKHRLFFGGGIIQINMNHNEILSLLSQTIH